MNKENWKLPPLPLDEIQHSGCLNCPGTPPMAKMYTRVVVGFGFAGIKKDGEIVYSEPPEWKDYKEHPTLMRFENMARKDPDHDWRLILDGPLHGETYQRHGKNEWVLVESNRGFA